MALLKTFQKGTRSPFLFSRRKCVHPSKYQPIEAAQFQVPSLFSSHYNHLINSSIMQFSSSLLHFSLLLASTVAGQLGGGPNTGAGAWNVNWPDKTIRQPTDLKATPLGNNAYTVTFKRDTKDNKYQLSYWIAYGSGERYAGLPKFVLSLLHPQIIKHGPSQCTQLITLCSNLYSGGQEETKAVDLAYVGSPDASGFQTYSARLPSAKSTRFTTPTKGIRIYFSPKNTRETGWVTTIPV